MKKRILTLACFALLCACQNSPARPEVPKKEEKTEQKTAEQQPKTELTEPKPEPEPVPEVKNYKISDLLGFWDNTKPLDEFDGRLVFKKNGKCGFQPFDEVYNYKLEGDLIKFTSEQDKSYKNKAKILELTPKTMKLQYEQPTRTLNFKRG